MADPVSLTETFHRNYNVRHDLQKALLSSQLILSPAKQPTNIDYAWLAPSRIPLQQMKMCVLKLHGAVCFISRYRDCIIGNIFGRILCKKQSIPPMKKIIKLQPFSLKYRSNLQTVCHLVTSHS